MKRLALVVALLGLAFVAGPAAAVGPGPVHQCGTFVSYRPPSSTRSGELIIDSTTFAAAWMGSTGPAGSTPHPFNQVIASGVTPGSQACLDGTVVASQTESNLLTDFIVSPVAAATASPAASTSPAPSSPPSTSSQPQSGVSGLDVMWVLIALAAALIVGLLIARRRSIAK